MIHANSPRTAVILPCLDDWASLEKVMGDLDETFSRAYPTDIVVVDDGSSIPPDAVMLQRVSTRSESCRVLELSTNVGHQRALCIGLSYVLSRMNVERLALMDSDGEDKPSSLMILAAQLDSGVTGVVVSERGKRSDGARFRIFHAIFRIMFRIFTGRELTFGNFMIMDRASAESIAGSPDAWNNIPTTVMRSKVKVHGVRLDRGQRHADQSKMGFVGLVNHGLGAISTFADVVFARLIVFATGAFLISLVVGLVALVTRLIIGQPLPGWLALGTTAVALGSLLVLALVTLLTFSMLGQRRLVTPPPLTISQEFIRSVTAI